MRSVPRSRSPTTSSAGALTDQAHAVDLQPVLAEREVDRPVVANLVVDQPQAHRVHAQIALQARRIVERPDQVQHAGPDHRRERREGRAEDAEVRIERRVDEVQRDVTVGVVVERHAAGARHGESRRRHLERVDVHLLLANRQLRGDLADALVADVEVVDRRLHVVARRLEGRVALGHHAEPAREGHAFPRQGVDARHGNALALHLEAVRASPGDVGRPVHVAAGLGDDDVVEEHAEAVEPERGRGGVEGLVVADARSPCGAGRSRADRDSRPAPGSHRTAGRSTG